MTKDQVAAALLEIGTLLELRGENRFKVNAYLNGARTIEQMDEDLATLCQEGRLGEVRGVGSTLCDVITTLVTTGSHPLLDQLRAETPIGLMQMLRLPGVGPKKVKALHESGISDLEALRTACQADEVAKLKGFGAKTQQKILEGIDFVAQSGQRIRLDRATELADLMIAGLRAVPGVTQIMPCGSLRRRRETIGDIDLLAAAADPGPVMDAFAALPRVRQVVNRGDTLCSVMVAVGDRHGSVLRSDLRVVTDEQFPFALHYFTGSKAHNVAVRGRAQARGLKLNEYSLVGPKRTVKCKTESDLFGALDLDYIPPELREDNGEIAAAESHTLPRLVEVKDVRGVFHNHTTASDGRSTLEEMVEAARELGFEYLGIADHSQSLVIANGLDPARVRQQHREIDRLNATLDGFRVFKGIECDILPDGSLDFDDAVLSTFDYVVASVHTHFGQSREEMTARVVRAVRHPRVTMLGHATGRLLLRREGYQVDLEKVLKAAADAGTMVEINAQPRRLDLDWVHVRRAKALGIPLVINPDAHETGELEFFRYGVDVARRGWLEAKDVFNTRTLGQVEKALLGKR
jgi:DNA polymerase (family 10)